jgi:hypothetical protein
VNRQPTRLDDAMLALAFVALAVFCLACVGAVLA